MGSEPESAGWDSIRSVKDFTHSDRITRESTYSPTVVPASPISNPGRYHRHLASWIASLWAHYDPMSQCRGGAPLDRAELGLVEDSRTISKVRWEGAVLVVDFRAMLETPVPGSRSMEIAPVRLRDLVEPWAEAKCQPLLQLSPWSRCSS